jgi:hypothetical protein
MNEVFKIGMQEFENTSIAHSNQECDLRARNSRNHRIGCAAVLFVLVC